MHGADHKQASKMEGAGGTVVAVGCPKERAVKVLDLATGTVYFTFTDTAMPTRGGSLATLGGAGAAEVSVWLCGFVAGASCSFDFHTPQHHTN